MTDEAHADLILHGGKLTNLDSANPSATALAVKGERILTVGSDQQALMHFGGPRTTGLYDRALLNRAALRAVGYKSIWVG